VPNLLTTLSFLNPKFGTGDFTDWHYDAGFIVTTTSFDDTPPFGCTYMAAKGPFGGGVGVTQGNIWQVRDISAYASYIDAGSVTTGSWSVQHSERDDQVDDGKTFMAAYSNNDGTGTLLATWSVLAPNHSPRPGWETLTMTGKSIPVGTRSLVLGATSIWFEGGTNDNQWADFIGPQLFTSLPIGTTHDFAVAFGGTGTLAIAAPNDISPGDPGAPVVTQNFGLDIRPILRLGLGMLKFPDFDCNEPAPATWGRHVPELPSWTCAVVEPPEPCEPAEAANDDLDLVSGDRLVTVDGYGLKLVS
jgi:hypothetical protein